MPLPRFERLHLSKRTQLLRAAAREFAEKGYDGASLNDILATAGLGKSSYYYYFADKEDLFATVIEGYWEEALAAGGTPPDPKKLTARTFWPAMEEWSRRSLEYLADHPELVALSRQVWLAWRTPSPRFKGLVERALTETRALLSAGRKLGCVRTDIDLDWLVAITRAADQAVDERLFAGGRRLELAEHLRIALDTFRRLVEVRR